MQEIPVEGLEMADVKNDAMPLGNGTVVDCIGLYEGKERVTSAARLEHSLQ
jgi:hypothetical protein